jgi:hypothetical protein
MKTKWCHAALLGIVSLTLSSCSMMLPDRSFMEQMERESDPFYAPGKDFPIVGGDDGETHISREEMMARTPASRRSSQLTRESASITEELASREADLSEEEMYSYSLNKKYLETDSDKLYYLSLNSDEQNSYISSLKNDVADELDLRKNMMSKHSVHSSELYLGMGKTDVMGAWGKPGRVEIAGNPSNQNERWSFFEDGSIKQVYFEGGKVQGWALDL